jgi:hypothetical protein
MQIPLIDRAGIRMRWRQMHNKQACSLTVKENLTSSSFNQASGAFQMPPLSPLKFSAACPFGVRLAHSASDGIL